MAVSMSRRIAERSFPLTIWPTARLFTASRPRALMYHRFSENIDPRRTHAELLRQHLEIALENHEVVTFTEMMRRLESGDYSRRRPLLSFTVDDGYRDFFLHASGVFRELGAPATVFVTAGFVEDRGWLWPDALEYLVFNSSFENRVVKFRDTTLELDLSTPSARRDTWDRLATSVLYDNSSRVALICSLAECLQVDLPKHCTSEFEPMSWEEVRMMSECGMEIGAHTWSHAFLPDLSADALHHELVGAKAHIEARIGKSVTSFAYPNGQYRDAPDALAKIVAESGYECATVATKPCAATLGDRYRVGRWTADENLFSFQNVLSGASALMQRLRASEDVGAF
jgi:peptidoglycan/xylan/chitin deacetylase (PgdA/CDA1 family)